MQEPLHAEYSTRAADVAAAKVGQGEAHPLTVATLLSKVMLYWATSLVVKGYNKLLMPSDLWPVLPEVSSEALYARFMSDWNAVGVQDATVLKAIKGARRPLFLSATFQFLFICMNFAVTLMLLWLIQSLQDPTAQRWLSWMYASLLIMCSFFAAFFRAHSLFQMAWASIVVRNMLITSVYQKATKLSSKALLSTDSGNIINLMSSDANRINQVGRWLMLGFMAPVELIGAFIFMGFVVGWYTMVAFGIMVVSVPINGVVAKLYFGQRERMNPFTDSRLKRTGEFIKYIRAIKYYAWEMFFMQRIMDTREEELDVCWSMNQSRSMLLQVSQAVGSVSLAAVLCSYVGGGNVLTPAVAFVILRLIFLLRNPFIMLPVALSSLGNLKSSFDRITQFLKLPELDTSNVDRTCEAGVVAIQSGEFAWGDKPTLRALDVAFPRGKLTIVVGQVGSGKSSLLQAILGNMEKSEGATVKCGGRVAYAAQTAFVINDTIRDNVCFGLPYNEDHYHRCVAAADLATDLKLLPGGDLTEIGERGINLSGGQKQRVALARALYADADVVLLDDPLSAVDAHVGEHIFEHAVQGMLTGKTVVLVSNQLQYLPSADYVVALEDGTIREQGLYQDLVQQGRDFAALVESFGVHRDAEAEEARKKARSTASLVPAPGGLPLMTEGERRKVSLGASPQLDEMRATLDKDRFLAGRLVMAESMVGSQYMDTNVYKKYLFSGNIWIFIGAIVVLMLSSIASFFPGLWIGFWSGSVFGSNAGMYEGVLWMFVVVEMITYYLASAMMVKHGQIASRVLHHALLARLAHAVISFFDSTPVGRILNRFSKDLDNLDTMVSFQLQQYTRVGIQLLILIGFIGYGSPWLLLAVGPLLLFFWLYLRYFRRTSVRLQRIEAITLSPIFQHFAETLPGLSTIRAFGMTELESRRNFTYVNGETLAEFAIRAVDSWVAVRLDLLCVLANLVVCFVMIGTSSNAYVAGFTINFVLVTVQLLSFFSLNMAQLETQMNGAERVMEYSENIEQEAPFEVPAADPGPEWPQRGEIQFDDVRFAYRPGLPNVLDGVTVTIQGGHKVGVVGRTGAGKSSLLVILLRMVELNGGAIRVDGVDISKIGLHTLRSRIAIIPQEPTLFNCSIRENLDPFSQHSNDELWEVLKLSGMSATIEKDGGLDASVSEDGSNYSLGQRQLLCMARALLRRPKILLMDEATASVDMENDMLIQETVRREFVASTVLTIAHRLHSVVDSDEVLVLDKGHLAEMARPDQLVQREGSLFKSLIDATGSSSSQHLMNYIMQGKAQGKSIANLMMRGREASGITAQATTSAAAKSVRAVRLEQTKGALVKHDEQPAVAAADTKAVVAVAHTEAPARPHRFVYVDDYDEDSFEDFLDFVVAKPGPGRNFKQ